MLTTSRLLLRDLVPSDAEALNEIERNPDVVRYMSFDPQTPEQTVARLERVALTQAETPRTTYDLAIVMRTEPGIEGAAPALIGRCGLAIRRPEHREAELWYVLHPDRRGCGYASEAVRALLGFAFGTLGLHRVYADCDPRNTASCALAQRAGMTLEGVLRENYWLKGEWCSSNVYAMLDREWAARQGGGAPAE